jgi:hypothetical protein
MIDLHQKVVAIEEIRHGIHIVASGSGIVLVWIEAEKAGAQGVFGPAGCAIRVAGGDDVFVTGHGHRKRRVRASPLAFESGEEESSVVFDGSAGSASKIAVLERTLSRAGERLEEIARI